MGTQERREREKKRREEEIIDAAESVFFGKGFDNSTMDDVAAEAELSKGALYKYFTSKNELCTAIVSRAMKLVIEHFEKACAMQHTNGLEKLRQLCCSFLEFYRKYPKYYCALQNYRHHRSSCGAGSSVLQETIDENTKINSIIESVLKAGMADGSLNQEPPPSVSSAMLWGDVNGVIPSCALSLQSKEGEKLFELTIETIIKGLRGEKS